MASVSSIPDSKMSTTTTSSVTITPTPMKPTLDNALNSNTNTNMSVNAPPTPPTTATKGRRGAAAGGGKAWTEEEEVYLLQMRLERVAYKKIASHLDKTELACRLHYHQLSHGGNRRKRNNSISSSSSSTSACSTTATSPIAATTAAAKNTFNSTPTSPCSPAESQLGSSFSPVNGSGAIKKVGKTSISPLSKIKGKPLLPKPAEHGEPTNGIAKRQTNGKSGSGGGAGKQLRVHCNSDSIDKDKLRRIVKANESKFWETIAAQYGGSIEGEYLRAIWRQQESINSTAPPTPAISPASSTQDVTSPSPTAQTEDEGLGLVVSGSEASSPTFPPPPPPTAIPPITYTTTNITSSSLSSTPSASAIAATIGEYTFSSSEVTSIKEEKMDDIAADKDDADDAMKIDNDDNINHDNTSCHIIPIIPPSPPSLPCPPPASLSEMR